MARSGMTISCHLPPFGHEKPAEAASTVLLTLMAPSPAR